MSILHKKAHEILDRLERNKVLCLSDYGTISAALKEINTLDERDAFLEELWSQYVDIPVDPDTRCITEPFLYWGAGTICAGIEQWFDHRHSKGVAYLWGRDGVDRTDKTAKLVFWNQFCTDCESRDCPYNHEGECRFALVHECKPSFTEADGCHDYCVWRETK